MKVNDAIWFTQMGERSPIGIVFAQDEITGERKIYIGQAFGQDEGNDIEHILETGASVYAPVGNHIVNFLSNKKG